LQSTHCAQASPHVVLTPSRPRINILDDGIFTKTLFSLLFDAGG